MDSDVYRDLSADGLVDDTTEITREVCRISLTDPLRSRLQLPRVLLVGLSPSDGFAHTPMIALVVNSVAAVRGSGISRR